MALTREQFQQLRDRGLSTEQIIRFESGQKPEQKKPGIVSRIMSSFGDPAKPLSLSILEAAQVPQAIAKEEAQKQLRPITSQFGTRPVFDVEIPFTTPEQAMSGESGSTVAPSGQDIAEGAVGLMIDVATPFIGAKGASAGASSVRGLDKQITSGLRRLGGKTSDEIKDTRRLTQKLGLGSVISKAKAKPKYLGTEITPKMTELASRRVRDMEPDALREIGISPESIEIAQRAKRTFGLKEFPTEASANELFESVINSAPDTSRIMPTKLADSIAELESSDIRPRELASIKKRIAGKTDILKGSEAVRGLSPSEYRALRNTINDLTEGGNNPFFQKLKNALDDDASDAIPRLAEAKGVFQVSRELSKAETYLNKPKLEQEMLSTASRASDPKNVPIRESLKRLLGPESEGVIDEIEAQRLAKEWYGYGNPPGVSGRPVLDIVKGLLRPLPRTYERLRAGITNPFIERRATGAVQELPAQTQPTPIRTPLAQPEQAPDLALMAQRSREFTPKPVTPVSEAAILAAQEDATIRAVQSGELGFSGGGGGRYPDVELRPTPIDYTKFRLKDMAQRKKGKK